MRYVKLSNIWEKKFGYELVIKRKKLIYTRQVGKREGIVTKICINSLTTFSV